MIKQKKVLLFSRDPGVANTIIPLIEPLKERGYKIRLFGKEFALKQYLKFGFTGEDVYKYVPLISQNNIVDFIKREKPDCIVSGTSIEDFTERYIWKAAQSLNIPTFAIIDQWTHYAFRFSEFSTVKVEKKSLKLINLPSFIFVMDERVKEELVERGIDSTKVVITGHPYFEFLCKQKNKIFQIEIDKFRVSLGIVDCDFVITFASEPVLRDYGGAEYWGYSERTIFENFFNSLKKIAGKYSGKIKVIIKIHPRENADYYFEFINSAKLENISFVIDQKIASLKIILVSDLICGMSSMFLLEAALLGKNILSIQIGLKRENPFILARKGLVESVYDNKALTEKLRDLILNKKLQSYKFDFIKNSVDKIINHIEEKICQN